MRAVGFSVLLLFGKMAKANGADKVYWYAQGEKQTYPLAGNAPVYKIDTEQNDALSFTHSGLAYIVTLTQHGSQIVKLHTDGNTDAVKTSFKEYLSNKNIASKALLAISYTPHPQVAPREVYLDGQLLVKFNSPHIPQNVLEQFSAQYGLQIVHTPSSKLPVYGNYTYIFVLAAEQTIEKNAATVAAEIYEENSSIIAEAIPNTLNMFKPDGETGLMSNAWHLDNQGQTTFCNVAAQQLCDTKITDVWNMGFTGQGIKVGIIDVNGFDFNHPDMRNQFLPGWDFINNRALTASASATTNQSHGMAVAGIIAANGKGNGGAAGVAYGAKIVPFLVDLSEASIIQALQKAMLPEYDVDILNCSFSGTGNSPLIEQEIINLTQFGRQRFGQTLGVVIVCSSGNDNMSDEFVPYYPAAYEQVINVTASTPEDKKKDFNDKWNFSSTWAPNYGKKLHIAAPGLCIPTTDFSGAAGYSTSNYISFSKTSSSAPVIAGVAALLLSKNQNISWSEVKQMLADGADKVGSYNYNYDSDKSGHSKEMGYGRVNAKKTLDGVTVGVGEVVQQKHYSIVVENPVSNNLLVMYNIEAVKGNFDMHVYDLSGNLIKQAILPKDQTRYLINMDDVVPGMYISKFFNKEEEIVTTSRFIKLW
jgi:subtilisin family serine protease